MGALASIAINAGMQGASAVMGGQESRAQIAYQRAGLRQQEMSDRAAANQSEQNRQRALAKTLAAARASYAARGIDGAQGSAAAVQAGIVGESAADGQYVGEQYERAAAARRLQDSMLKRESSMVPLGVGVSAASSVVSGLMQWSQLGVGWFSEKPRRNGPENEPGIRGEIKR